MVKLKDIINLNSYPIDQSITKVYKDLVLKYIKELDIIGCWSLPEFIQKESIY